MATSTKVNGLTTKLKAWEPTVTPTVPTMRVSGSMISSMVTESNLGQMAPGMKETTKMERRRVKVD